jgi:ubiquinone/menaquinone biosynthesis C-methylase UbiE
MREDRRRFWRKLAQEVSDDLASDDRPEYRTRRAKMLRHLVANKLRGKDVLEVGCGPGGNLAALESFGVQSLAGCDIAPEMLSLAAKRTSAKLVQSEEEQLPFADNAFDIVLTVTVLQHVVDDSVARDLCGEMGRVAGRTVLIYEDMHDANPLGDGQFPWVARPRKWYREAFMSMGMSLLQETRIDSLVDHEDSPDSGLFCLEFCHERRRKKQ